MEISKTQLNNSLMNQRKWRNNIPYFLVAGFFIFLGWVYYFPSSPRFNLGNFSQTAQISDQSGKKSPFENIKLETKSAYIFDVLKNQPIFEFNSESQLPLASLTKIMTALVAKEKLPSYLLVTISREAVSQKGDEGFAVGEQWPISDLIDAMLISSSNDAAYALASEFNKDFNGDFISLMNQKAQELDLTQTYFLNATGLDVSKNISGGYGSSKDVAKLILYAIKNDYSLMEVTRLNSLALHSRQFKNTNQVINDLPGFIAGKTGFSDLADGNLAIVADKGYGHPFIIVVLGSTFDGRFSDVKTLYNLIP